MSEYLGVKYVSIFKAQLIVIFVGNICCVCIKTVFIFFAKRTHIFFPKQTVVECDLVMDHGVLIKVTLSTVGQSDTS